MSAYALSLVLVAALIHATWNLLAKRSGGDVRFALLTSLVVAVVWAPAGLWLAWRDVGGYGLLQWSLMTASGVLHVGYFVVLLRGYRVGDLTVVYPLARGTGPLITALAATTLLGESLGRLGWLGVLGIVGGIVLIAGGADLLRALRAGTHSPADVQRLRAGIGYGVLTGLFISGYSLVDGYAVQHAGITPVLADYLGNLVRIPLTWLLILWLRRSQRLSMGGYLRRYWKPALAIGTISPAAYMLVLYAATMAPLSQVAPAREVSMLFATFFGGHLLGEKGLWSRLAGAACIAGGVAALALAK